MRKLAVVIVPWLLPLAIACSKSSEAKAEPAATPPAASGAAADTTPPKARAEGQGYVVEVKPPAAAQVGAPAKAQIVLHPTGGYHVNKEFPIVLAVTAPAGVDVTKAKQSGADAAKLEEGEAIFEIPFTPKEAGDKAFAASFRFAVCTATTCDPHNEKLGWSVAVK